MDAPVDNGAPRPVPTPWFEVINENFQQQNLDLTLHERSIACNMWAIKGHGDDIRRIDADVAGLNARQICETDRTNQRFYEVEDRTSIIETEHAVLQQQVETSQDDLWQAIETTEDEIWQAIEGTQDEIWRAIEDTRSELVRRANHPNDQHRNNQQNVWDTVRGIATRIDRALEGLNETTDDVQPQVDTLKQRMDGAEREASDTRASGEGLHRRITKVRRQASKTSNQVRRLKAYGHRLEEEMRRTARENKELLAQRDAILDRHESTIRDLQPDLATDRLANELGRLSINGDTTAAENHPPNTNALVPWNARPAVPDATNRRVDELQRTFQEYYRRLQARTERVERLGRENQAQSDRIIRECNVGLAKLMVTMQMVNAIHFAIAAALNDHDTVLREHGRRLGMQSTALHNTREALASVTRRQLVDREQLDGHATVIQGIGGTLINHRARLDDHDALLNDHEHRLAATNRLIGMQSTRTTETLDDHGRRLDTADTRTDRIDDRLDEMDTELGVQSTRTDRVHDRLDEMQANREDDLTRMDETEDEIRGQTNTIFRIYGTLDDMLSDRDEDLDRMDMTEDRLTANIQRIDGTLDEMRTNRADDLARMDATDERITANIQRVNGTLNDLRTTQARQQGYNLLATGTQARLGLLEQEHTRMSQFIQSRVNDAMEGNIPTGMSRVMDDMNDQIQRLVTEVAK
ncbi:MAG: hypothetical protein Q9184_003527 [Pyrenodesmia sp. 2 TL-2023]